MLLHNQECFFCKTEFKNDDKVYSLVFCKGYGTITALACEKCYEREDLERQEWKKC